VPPHPNLHVDVAVIGAGVIGLAVARALALAGREVVVLESEPRIGVHTSSRNSEVIHAGIYYPRGSLKALACVEGKRLLYAYCEAREIAHSRVGKLLVATADEEVSTLERLKRQAEENGVHDLTWLDRAEAHDLEPAVRCVRALLSPSTGIVDAHGLMQALAADARQAGCTVALSTPVAGGRVATGGIELWGEQPEPYRVRCEAVVNAAGLWAPVVAARIEGMPREKVPSAHFAKGHYFVLAGSSPFRHLVYPVPAPGGLGVHVTLDLAGAARFGPDVHWIDAVDYAFEPGREAAFAAAVRRYYPGLDDGKLAPGYTGIRPKLAGAGAASHDFVVQGPNDHGITGLVNLFGIESPGLTASLSLAERVRALLV
jgi:L-2-hydroxyglutarate oxidase LhgO